MNLNVGCGSDSWGDVRVDIAKQYHRKKTAANVVASAEALPFKDKCFMKLRASHVLEHLLHWKAAVQEWCRVTDAEVEIEVPLDAGFVKREIYHEILSLSPKVLYELYLLPQRRREHLWKFTQKAVVHEVEKYGFVARSNVAKAPLILFLACGRKSKFLLFKKISEGLQIDFAYRITAIRSLTASQ